MEKGEENFVIGNPRKREEKKMNKNRTKKTILAAVCLLAFSASAAFASNAVKNITVYYQDIKIVVDGIKQNPSAEPFIYNGTTYLPVRAVGEALGEKVNWDQNTKTVTIGENPTGTKYLLEVCPPYQNGVFNTALKNCYLGSNGDYFLMAGEKYTNGIAESARTLYFNLKGQYKEMTLTLGPVDGSGSPALVRFVVDGTTVAEYDVETGDMPKDITVPLNYGKQLRIEMPGIDDTGLGNIIVR